MFYTKYFRVVMINLKPFLYNFRPTRVISPSALPRFQITLVWLDFPKSGIKLTYRPTHIAANTKHLYNVEQCWTNVKVVGPALYGCYINVLCLPGYAIVTKRLLWSEFSGLI